jgi:hypothetical protein
MALRSPIDLPLEDLSPPADRFHRRSVTHGPAHVARTMIHTFLLLDLTDAREEATRLWAAVYLHDLARTHDGVCYHHGAAAAALLEEPGLRAHLARGGLTDGDVPAVAAAVTAHSLPEEPPRDHPHLRLVRLLKDADGLDRVRLRDLDPSRLRHDAARELVPFARRLLHASEKGLHRDPAPFPALFSIAQGLLGKEPG